ncbi:MAG TPA: macrolide transporter subunit MacA [Verrucomicrobiae bacterium]|nr:macrolide transporter subunit MacA [Verrucomicrobiae bacterium]
MLLDVETAAETDLPARRRPKRWLMAFLTLLVVVAIAAGIYGWRHWQATGQPEIRTAEVALGDIEKSVTALGTLQPKDYVDVGAQVSGQLDTVHVEIGDLVKKDQLLAEIDPTVIETRVRTDKANLDNLQAQFAQQQAELKLARLQLKRNQALYKSKAISQDALQTTETQVAVGEAKADALSAQIAAAQATYDGEIANLGYTKIYAPMAGTIVSQTALEGQTLNANQTAPTILRVADLQTMTVKAQVAEADVVKLTPGMPVYFTTLGLPERRWRATVRQILPTPETVNDVVLYNVLVDVENDDGVLMTSMTAQVFFVLGEAKQVPLIPIAALGKKQPGSDDEYLVRVMTAKGPEPRAVKVGLMDRKSAQVVDGIAAGDRVVLEAPANTASGSDSNRPFGMGFRL